MDHRFDITIFAPRASPLYTTPPGAAPGGAEVQMTYLAGALAAHGLRVCHILFENPRLPTRSDGVEVITMPGADAARTRKARARALVKALNSADASAYVQRSAGPHAGVLALFARARRRRFILSTSWDADLTDPLIPRQSARALFRLGVRLADAIVVQTDDQRRTAADRIRGRLRVIRSIAEPHPDAGAERTGFLWIGRIVNYKDPLAYVELAARVPEARFSMVADTSGNADQELADRVRARATELDNLEVLDARPRESLSELYDRALAVVNTSEIEGFPNTFMEGWARGAAALSLRLDPDRIIQRNALGTCADGSIEVLADAARDLWARGDDRDIAERARRYIADQHSSEAIAGQWRDLLQDLARG